MGSVEEITFEVTQPTRVRNGRSRSSKVVDLGTNRKRVSKFLLLINSNLAPILPHFRDIAGILLRTVIPPLFHPNFGGVPLGLDRRCWGSEKRRPHLVIRAITFEVTQPTLGYSPRYVNVTDGRTDDL